MHNIAGVTNAEKNVMGMMPHPERAVDALLGNQDGVSLFESLLNLAKFKLIYLPFYFLYKMLILIITIY